MVPKGYESAILFEQGVAGQNHSGYELQRELGSGGQATVYLARDLGEREGRNTFALKIFAPFTQDVGDKRLQQFLSEGRRAILVRHENVLPAYTFNLGTVALRGADHEHPFIRMAYAEGGSLQDQLRRGVPPGHEVARIMHDITEGTQAIHDKGMLHLDLKPANILRYEGKNVVTDLGVAIDGHDINTRSQVSNPDIAGTPLYMAPEHLQGKPVKQSDIYAAGIIAFQLLTGKLPFKGATPHEIIAAHLLREPLTIKEAIGAFAIPISMERAEVVIRQALQKDPARRHSRIDEFGQELQRALTGRPSVQIQPTAQSPPLGSIREQPTLQQGSKYASPQPEIIPQPQCNEQYANPALKAAELAVKALAEQARRIAHNDATREHERKSILLSIEAIGKAVCLFNVPGAKEIAQTLNAIPGSLDFEFALRCAIAMFDPEEIAFSPTNFRTASLSTSQQAHVAEILLDPSLTKRQLKRYYKNFKDKKDDSIIPLLAQRDPGWAIEKAKNRHTTHEQLAEIARSLLTINLDGAKIALAELERYFYAGSRTHGGHDFVVPVALQFIPYAPDVVRNLIYRRLGQGPRFARVQYNSLLRIGLAMQYPEEISKALAAEGKDSAVPSWFEYVQNPQKTKALKDIIENLKNHNDPQYYWLRAFAIAAVVAHQRVSK